MTIRSSVNGCDWISGAGSCFEETCPACQVTSQFIVCALFDIDGSVTARRPFRQRLSSVVITADRRANLGVANPGSAPCLKAT